MILFDAPRRLGLRPTSFHSNDDAKKSILSRLKSILKRLKSILSREKSRKMKKINK